MLCQTHSPPHTQDKEEDMDSVVAHEGEKCRPTMTYKETHHHRGVCTRSMLARHCLPMYGKGKRVRKGSCQCRALLTCESPLSSRFVVLLGTGTHSLPGANGSPMSLKQEGHYHTASPSLPTHEYLRLLPACLSACLFWIGMVRCLPSFLPSPSLGSSLPAPPNTPGSPFSALPKACLPACHCLPVPVSTVCLFKFFTRPPAHLPTVTATLSPRHQEKDIHMLYTATQRKGVVLFYTHTHCYTIYRRSRHR